MESEMHDCNASLKCSLLWILEVKPTNSNRHKNSDLYVSDSDGHDALPCLKNDFFFNININLINSSGNNYTFIHEATTNDVNININIKMNEGDEWQISDYIL